MKKLLIITILIIQTASVVLAKTPAASFLRIDTNARPAAMAGAFTAISDDASAIKWNPAGLSQLYHREIIVSHNEWIDGIKNEYAAYAHPYDKNWAFGAAVNYLHINGLIERDSYGAETGNTFGGSNSVISIAASRKLNPSLSLGVGTKMITETVYDKSARAFGIDLGLLLSKNRFRFGLTLKNLGSSITLYEEAFPLPRTFTLAAGYISPQDLKINLDIDKPTEGNFSLKLGSEYQIMDLLCVRMGYKTAKYENTGSGITFGLGFNYNDYKFDYGFLPYGDFGITHRITFGIKFRNVLVSSKFDKGNIEQMFIEAMNYYKEGNYSKAMQLFNKILRIDPNHSLAKTMSLKAAERELLGEPPQKSELPDDSTDSNIFLQ